MMTDSRTIVLWAQGDLLGSSVARFLAAREGWHVINVSNEEDVEALTRVVDEVRPDVVIIQQEDRSGSSNLPVKLLKNRPGLRVITLTPNDNLIEVYSKHNFMVKSASDLISVVEADLIQSTEQSK